MAVKRYNPATGNWEVFPGTAGDDAYEMAKTNGYAGTKEEYISALIELPAATSKLENIDETATEGSLNLINSNAVWKVREELKQALEDFNGVTPTLVEKSESEITSLTSGLLVSGWAKSDISVASYSENTLNYSYILSSVLIKTWTSPYDYTILYKSGWNSSSTGNYLYRVEWLGKYISIELETYETKAVSAGDTSVNFTISNLDGSPAYGVLQNNTSGKSSSISDGVGVLSVSASDLISMFNEGEELAGSRNITSSDISSQAVVWQLDNNLCTKQVNTSAPVSSEPDAELVTYSILADVVYSDDKPYAEKEIAINYNDVTGTVISTDENGSIDFSVSLLSAPVSVEIMASANTLFNGSPDFDKNNSADLGTLIVPESSGSYHIQGKIYYSDNVPYEGNVNWADGEGMSGSVSVIDGAFISDELSKATGLGLSLSLLAHGETLYIDNVELSYNGGYIGTFDPIILDLASTTAAVSYKLTGQINYKDNVGYSGEATLSSSLMNVLEQVDEGYFEWSGDVNSGVENTMTLVCGEDSFTITNDWSENYSYDFGTVVLSTFSEEPTLVATIYNEDGSVVNSDSVILQYNLLGYANPINVTTTIIDGKLNYTVPKEHYSLGICNLLLFSDEEQIVDSLLNEGNCIFWSDSSKVDLGNITLNTTLEDNASVTEAPTAGTTAAP